MVTLTLRCWAVFELGLIIADWVRGKGDTTQDRGTRRLTIAVWITAFLGASLAAGRLRHDGAVQFGHGHVGAGLAVIWAGLALRLWAVLALGPAFSTTVEVEAGQEIVDGGPYRWVRHPSYTGILIVALGLGVVFGNWLSLAVIVLLPLAALLRRIAVEEAAMAEILGEPYLAYRSRTRRLIPWVW